MAIDITIADARTPAVRPTIRRIGLADLREALKLGVRDYGEHRTDVLFLCLIYPVIGLVLARISLGQHLLPLIFPLIAGFALLGPFAAIGLYQLSLRREQGLASTWRNMFDVLHARALGAILLLGLLLCALFVIWLQVALGIFELCMGGAQPDSPVDFLAVVLTTDAGWAMIVIGNLVGLVFAVVAFALSVVSFPLLLDRELGQSTGEQLSVAVLTSVRAVRANPGPMAVWGLIVAALLALGSLPALVGLIVVMPVLGHASWYLYRRVVAPGP
jgi:uncharacterized membrane protein